MSKTVSLPDLQIELGVRVSMRDGVELATDIYCPVDAHGPWPVLLLRTPYGRGNVESEAYVHPAWYVNRGFVVVSQDVRGCWDSDGVFAPFEDEGVDGEDTLEWVVHQPWCDGSIGTFGFSYPGATQMLAASQSRHLKAMVPAMTGASYCEGWTYRQGVLNLAFVVSWAVGLARNQAIRAGDLDAVHDFDDLLENRARLCATLPVRDVIPEHLLMYAPYFREWLNHRSYDDYWRRHSPLEHYQDMTAPALHVAGWYDVFLEGTIDNYVAMERVGKAHQMLVVGPWYHMPWSRYVGEMDVGEAGKNLVDELQVRFFDRWLRDEVNGLDEEAPVQLYLLGSNTWIGETDWPPSRARFREFYLDSDGRAASLNGNGRLLDSLPTGGAVDGFLANPSSPVLSLGGRSASNPDMTLMGPMDQRDQEIRNEVLVYSAERLTRDCTIIGYPSVTLHVSSTAESSDFVVRLVDVHPDGRAINLCDGVARHVAPAGEVHQIQINLSPIANCFKAGHAIRLEITGSNFPMHERNPHCDIDPFDVVSSDFQMASQFVFHDPHHVSTLCLPIIEDGVTPVNF